MSSDAQIYFDHFEKCDEKKKEEKNKSPKTQAHDELFQITPW